MASDDITIEILKDIRDATRDTNRRLDGVTERLDGVTGRLDGVTGRLDGVTERLDLVETTLLDLAQQNRFIVRHLKTISDREFQLEPRVAALEGRVGKLESK